MKHNIIKQFALLLSMMLITVWCDANDKKLEDGYSTILVKEAHVESSPKSSSIQASINGHTLTVAFTENLGQVAVEVSSASGTSVHYSLTPTPNGFQVYITNNGECWKA